MRMWFRPAVPSSRAAGGGIARAAVVAPRRRAVRGRAAATMWAIILGAAIGASPAAAQEARTGAPLAGAPPVPQLRPAPSAGPRGISREEAARRAALGTVAGEVAPPVDPRLAKSRFAAVTGPTAAPARALGRYGLGCLAGAVELPAEGPNHSSMRLSRGRRWGHPVTLAFITDLAAAAAASGLNGILVGDMSQARGGPMLFGHSSHQVGLDVDIWFAPRPATVLTSEARETMPFQSVLNGDGSDVDPARFTPVVAALVRQAAADRRVARVFVHPHIKRAMCAMTWPDRSFLSRVRPWYGHDEHFHVRLACPADSPDCVPQAPPPPDDGCGDALAYWYTPAPYTPDPSAKPKPPLTVDRMPLVCRQLLAMPDRAEAYAVAPVPTGQETPVPPSPQ